MSKANKLKANELKTKVTLTRRIEVEYLRPVPLEQPLVAQGQVSRMKGRVLHNSAELRNAKGEVLARSRGVFLAIDAEKIFASEFENERRSAR
jgi:acyl-CoA thioesterase FadM